MKRTTIILIVIFYLVVTFWSNFSYLFTEESTLNPFDYARITDVDYKAVVVDEPNSSGKVLVTERLTFDIHAASEDNLFWELWRDLPEDSVDGLDVTYKVNSVKQILEDGSEVIYQESPKLYWDDYDYINTSGGYGPGKWYHSEGPYNETLRQYECVMFYVDGLYREEVVFEIEYEMYNAALRYNDCSELYLSLYSEETIKHLESYKAQILIPNKDMPSAGNYYANTYGTNSHEFPFTESTILNPGYHTFSFELNESDLKFRPYNEYIEFALVSYGTDKHAFTNYAPRNYYYYDNALDELVDEQTEYENLDDEYKGTKIVVLLICSAGAILVICYSFSRKKSMEKKHIFYKPTIQVEYFRDIPSDLDPNFAANLVFCKHKMPKDTDGYSALMLSLVRKGYIELARIDDSKDWTSNNIKIVRKIQPIDPTNTSLESYIEELEKRKPLTPAEEHYFNLIVRHSSNDGEISINSFQSKVSYDYEDTADFVKNIDNSIINIGISEGYFQKADYQEPKKQLKSQAKTFGIMGALVAIIVNLISYQTRLDLAFGAFFILGISFIIGALHFRKLSRNYVLLTPFGEDEYAKWRGLYNFLNSETLMNERTVVELPLWEQYLVYATAFGISDKVIAALKIRCPDIDMSPMLSNPYYRSTSFRYSSRSFRSATRSASYTARSGGYGGGWRIRWRRPWRRWRPEAVTSIKSFI